jgi:2'-hydroxyisoflavone reductase
MGAWMIGLLERGESGAFHAAGPSATFTWGEELEAIVSSVAPGGTTLCWVDAAFLLDADVDDSALPLWPGVDPDMLMMTADPATALATGLTFRPLAETIRDTLAWTRTVEQPEKSGLSDADETALLEKWQAQRRV